jgi:hypothetical protein
MEEDARARRLLAIRRVEREGEQLGRSLDRAGEALARRESEVVGRLAAAGYVRHHGSPTT